MFPGQESECASAGRVTAEELHADAQVSRGREGEREGESEGGREGGKEGRREEGGRDGGRKRGRKGKREERGRKGESSWEGKIHNTY